MSTMNLKYTPSACYRFTINTLWDGEVLEHAPYELALQTHGDTGVLVDIQAPFFNDPGAPDGQAGLPFQQLWDYEGEQDIDYDSF